MKAKEEDSTVPPSNPEPLKVLLDSSTSPFISSTSLPPSPPPLVLTSTAIGEAQTTILSVTDVALDPIHPLPPSAAETRHIIERAIEYHSFSLLQTLHLIGKYSVVTGKALPMELEFMGKVLLGLSVDLTFEESLQQAAFLANALCNVQYSFSSTNLPYLFEFSFS